MNRIINIFIFCFALAICQANVNPTFGTNPKQVHEIQKKDKVLLYPNPARVQVSIKSTNKALIKRVEIYNILGTRVSVANGKNQLEVKQNVSKLKKGKYLVRVYFTDGSVAYSHLIKV